MKKCVKNTFQTDIVFNQGWSNMTFFIKEWSRYHKLKLSLYLLQPDGLDLFDISNMDYLISQNSFQMKKNPVN